MTDTIHIDDFPQLTILTWNRAVRDISCEEAFSIYERNWRFVDVDHLTEAEAALIQRLTDQYGRGVLNV